MSVPFIGIVHNVYNYADAALVIQNGYGQKILTCDYRDALDLQEFITKIFNEYGVFFECAKWAGVKIELVPAEGTNRLINLTAEGDGGYLILCECETKREDAEKYKKFVEVVIEFARQKQHAADN